VTGTTPAAHVAVARTGTKQNDNDDVNDDDDDTEPRITGNDVIQSGAKK